MKRQTKRRARWLAALVAAALMTLTGETGILAKTGQTPTPPDEHECEGTACSQVTLNWDDEEQRFRVTNNSDSKVKFEVTTFGGTSVKHVEPHKSDYLEVKYFNGAYRADYE